MLTVHGGAILAGAGGPRHGCIFGVWDIPYGEVKPSHWINELGPLRPAHFRHFAQQRRARGTLDQEPQQVH